MFSRPQQRKERVRHPDRAEHVDGKSLHCCVRRQILSAQPWCRSARVVDQYVEMAVVIADARGGRAHTVLVGRIDVEVDTTEFARGLRSAPRIARADEHRMTEIDEASGCLVAEAFVGSGDQSDRHWVSLQAPYSGAGIG